MPTVKNVTHVGPAGAGYPLDLDNGVVLVPGASAAVGTDTSWKRVNAYILSGEVTVTDAINPAVAPLSTGAAASAADAIAKVGSLITQALANGQRNVNFLVNTDSTGIDTVEQATGTDRRWVYLLAQLMGSDFPAYTVREFQWNDTNTNYDAAVIIQTGTGTGNAGGPFILSVYNASKSGANVSYWLGATRLGGSGAAVIPAVMDLILLSDGHNEVGNGSNMRPTYYKLRRAIATLVPQVPIAWVTQNPQNGAGSSSSSAEQTNQLLRMEVVRQLARSEGDGLIDVQPAFLADSGYATNLLNADGVHPSPAGSALWAAEVKKHFPLNRDRSGVAVGGPIPRQSRIWLPAPTFDLVSGTPTRTNVNISGTPYYPVWALPNGSDSLIATTADIPAGWQTVNIWIAYFTTTSSTGFNWRGRVGQRAMGGTFEPATAAGLTLVAPAAGSTNTIAGKGALVMGFSQLYSGTDAVTGFVGRPMYFNLNRLGTDGLDTIGQAVNFVGMWIERAS